MGVQLDQDLSSREVQAFKNILITDSQLREFITGFLSERITPNNTDWIGLATELVTVVGEIDRRTAQTASIWKHVPKNFSDSCNFMDFAHCDILAGGD